MSAEREPGMVLVDARDLYRYLVNSVYQPGVHRPPHDIDPVTFQEFDAIASRLGHEADMGIEDLAAAAQAARFRHRGTVVSVGGGDAPRPDQDVYREAIYDALAGMFSHEQSPRDNADAALNAVPDDDDTRTIGERLRDGAAAERIATWLADDRLFHMDDSWQVYLPPDEANGAESVGRMAMGAEHAYYFLADVDPTAADLLARLTADHPPGHVGAEGG